MSNVTGAAGKVVCVTGASGYIASWLVKFLLQRGYTVKASVRDPSQYQANSLSLSFSHCTNVVLFDDSLSPFSYPSF